MKEIPTHFRKMVKCMIYIGTYAWGKCVGIPFTPFTPFTASPRRPRPLGGSVINGTIQQLLDTPRAEPVTANLAGTPHSARRGFIHEDVARHPQRHTAPRRGFTHEDAASPPQRPVRGGAGIFPHWGILKNNRKESIHETRWTSPRRRASGWIPERRHGGHAGGAVGIAGRAGGCRYRGTGRHRSERHQRVGEGICGLCDTGPDSRAATGGTGRGAIARDTARYVRFGHRQLVAASRWGV